MRSVAITQPNFLPWIGYFEMIDRVDEVILLDDVQFIRREWVNRNRVAGAVEESTIWITAPVQKAPRETAINEIRLFKESRWLDKALQTIHRLYRTAPHFDAYFPALETALRTPHDRLLDLNVATIELGMACLGIETPVTLSSSYGIAGRRDDKLSDLCIAAEADVYLANNGSKTYIDPEKFTSKGVGFAFQDFGHPVYDRGQGRFVGYLSFVDLLFWKGGQSLPVVRSGRPENWEKGIRLP